MEHRGPGHSDTSVQGIGTDLIESQAKLVGWQLGPHGQKRVGLSVEGGCWVGLWAVNSGGA